MNDHVYTFVETVKDRKSLATSARHKVSGSKSKRCALPSDNLTPAEKKKLNGPVKTYAINRPMPWEAFKSMPSDLQQAHLDYVQSRFQLGAATISTDYFDMSHGALSLYAKKKGLTLEPFRGSAPAVRVNALRDWVAGIPEQKTETEADPVVQDVSVCTPEESRLVKDPVVHNLVLRELRMVLVGGAAQISQTLFDYLDGRYAEVEVAIKFKTKEEVEKS